MGINKARLIPTNAPLAGFGGTRELLVGSITLSVTVGNYPQQITKDVTFLVVDCSSAYNGILGRLTLNSWKAATSTYHLMIKFLTKYEIGQLLGDQVATCKFYIAMLELEDYQQTMYIGEQRTAVEPVEELEEIILDESRPEQRTRMGTSASPLIRQYLTGFLRMNQDVFAWSHEEMPGIDPSIIVHRLNVNPASSPIQ